MATTTGRKPHRITALDFTKGALVLIMVLYHWINYFWGPQDNRYLRFLTPSFIFISGFIISSIYFSKYGLTDPHLPKRLFHRGLKILGVFLLLNLSRDFVAADRLQNLAPSTEERIRSMFDIYVLGSGVGGGQTKAVAFFILVPISYLLLLSGVLLVLSRYFRFTFHAACLLSLLGVAISNFEGFEIPNLELLAIGFLGVITGYLPTEKVNAVARRRVLLAIGYLIYLGAISVWNVVYPLQVIGVCFSLLILYAIGLQGREAGKAKATVVLLGKYSLFGYIAQIAVLQSLRLGLNQLSSEAVILGLSFVLAFALTIFSVAVIDYARSGSAVVDRLYRFVFA